MVSHITHIDTSLVNCHNTCVHHITASHWDNQSVIWFYEYTRTFPVKWYICTMKNFLDVLVLQLVLVMSGDNFKFLRGQYNEYNHETLIEGSRMVVVSSKSVQCNLRYSIANQTGYKKFLPEIYNWSNWWVWSKFWSSEYDILLFLEPLDRFVLDEDHCVAYDLLYTCIKVFYCRTILCRQLNSWCLLLTRSMRSS